MEYNKIQEENKSIKIKNELKIVDNIDFEELNINKLVQNEVLNMMKENIKFKSRIFSIENFSLHYEGIITNKKINTSEKLRLLLTNVDDILMNIQKKKEALILNKNN